MNNILSVCPENSAYKYRPQTDVLFKLPDGSMKYSGVIDATIKYIQTIQLKRTDLWKQFVEQFRTHPDDDLRWRGEYWGKMMRGASFTYQYTQDEELYGIMTETVKDLLSTQDSLGRIATYSVEFEFDSWDLWCRKYVLLGFQYYLDICRDDALRAEVIKAMCRHADYIMSKVGLEEDGKKLITKCTRAWLGLNSSSILEPYVRLYNLTGEKKYLDYASYIVDCGGISEGNIFELAYEDKICPYEYPTTKAYEMMSCFEGLLEYYRVTKIQKHKEAVIRFAKRVMKSDITIIGCSGCTHEIFDFSAKAQTATRLLDVMQETCVTVTWMKLCHQLLSVTGEAEFADAIEISAYNAMLGSVNSYGSNMLNGFAFDSYAPLYMSTRSRKSGGYLNMKGDVQSYGCCACIGSAGTALMALSSIMQRKDGIAINLYIPGVIKARTPKGFEFELKIDTDYPVGNRVDITVVGVKENEEFTISYRKPSWCDSMSVGVNGENVKDTDITRAWCDGDKLTLIFDMPMKVILPPYGGADKNSKYLVALQKGPLVFARDARLGQSIDDIANIDYDKNMVVNAVKTDAPFECLVSYEIPNKDGTTFKVANFSSAGKTWNKESIMSVWLPTKNFWQIDFTKPFRMYNNTIDFSVLSEGDFRLVPTRNIRPEVQFTAENAGDGNYYLCVGGKYVTAAKYKGGLDRYYLVMRDKGEENQLWKFEKLAVNKYVLTSASIGLSATHAWKEHDIFILVDTKTNERVDGCSYSNNAYVDILQD